MRLSSSNGCSAGTATATAYAPAATAATAPPHRAPARARSGRSPRSSPDSPHRRAAPTTTPVAARFSGTYAAEAPGIRWTTLFHPRSPRDSRTANRRTTRCSRPGAGDGGGRRRMPPPVRDRSAQQEDQRGEVDGRDGAGQYGRPRNPRRLRRRRGAQVADAPPRGDQPGSGGHSADRQARRQAEIREREVDGQRAQARTRQRGARPGQLRALDLRLDDVWLTVGRIAAHRKAITTATTPA